MNQENKIKNKIVFSTKKSALSSTVAYRYSRTVKTEVQVHCTRLEHITILEGPNRYWVYDDDAITLSDLFGFELYKTKKGYTLVYEKSLHNDFVGELKTQGINCVIVHPDNISEILPTAIPLPNGEPLDVGVTFVLKDSDEVLTQYIIKNVVESELITVTHSDGSTEIVRKPILQDSSDPNIRVISHRAPIARLLIGKHVGDTITFNGESQKIVSIGNQP